MTSFFDQSVQITLFPALGSSSLPVEVVQHIEQLLCWSGMTDTEKR